VIKDACVKKSRLFTFTPHFRAFSSLLYDIVKLGRSEQTERDENRHA
jgi:hypothetical protein